MPKYRKKPVVIEAFQMTKERRWDNSEWPNWLSQAWNREHGENAMWPNPDAPLNPDQESADELVCGTLEGVHVITFGDFIIQGVKGEIYPCKPDIFEATYEMENKQYVTPEKGPPVYKKQLIDEVAELEIVKNFKEALLQFIKVMGLYYEEDPALALLLGQTEINIMEREETLGNLKELMEEE